MTKPSVTKTITARVHYLLWLVGLSLLVLPQIRLFLKEQQQLDNSDSNSKSNSDGNDSPETTHKPPQGLRSSSSSSSSSSLAITLADGYDVLDVGSSKGDGSITFLASAVAKLRFAEADTAERLDARTLGLDYDPAKVEECNRANRDSRNDCLLFNILTDTPEDLAQVGGNNKNNNKRRTISGNSYWHVLEHIPDCTMAHDMWTKAAAFSQRFSSFHGPAFDDELVAYGATPTGPHRFWEHWSGHTCHFNSTHMIQAIRSVAKTTSYVVVNYGKIETTDSDIVVPAGTPKNSHYYDPKTMGAKETVPLDPPRYEEMRACALYEPTDNNHLSLYGALCLRDALSAAKRLRKKGHLVKACVMDGTAATTPGTLATCAETLRARAEATLRRFEKMPAAEILRTI